MGLITFSHATSPPLHIYLTFLGLLPFFPASRHNWEQFPSLSLLLELLLSVSESSSSTALRPLAKQSPKANHPFSLFSSLRHRFFQISFSAAKVSTRQRSQRPLFYCVFPPFRNSIGSGLKDTVTSVGKARNTSDPDGSQGGNCVCVCDAFSSPYEKTEEGGQKAE